MSFVQKPRLQGHGMFLKGKLQRLTRKRLFILLLTSMIVLTIWWTIAGPRTLFYSQIWLMERGIWSNIRHWERHGNWYLPYLIEQIDNRTHCPNSTVLINRSKEGFESLVHYEWDTVGEAIQLTLTLITGEKEDVGNSNLQEVDHQRRRNASAFWREWYEKNKDSLEWDAKLSKFYTKSK